MKKLTVHELSVAKIKPRRHPEVLFTTGINEFLRELYAKHELWFDDDDFFERRPDAWSHVPDENDPGEPGTINIFEVEDSHKLSTEKIEYYSHLWFCFDDMGLELKLFVYDRYGENETELDLCEYWFMFLKSRIDQNPALV